MPLTSAPNHHKLNLALAATLAQPQLHIWASSIPIFPTQLGPCSPPIPPPGPGCPCRPLPGPPHHAPVPVSVVSPSGSGTASPTPEVPAPRAQAQPAPAPCPLQAGSPGRVGRAVQPKKLGGMVSSGGDASPKPYLLDDGSQLALDLQAEALDVPDEEFPMLALQGDMAGGWYRSLPPARAEPCPPLPGSPAPTLPAADEGCLPAPPLPLLQGTSHKGLMGQGRGEMQEGVVGEST